jgi:3-hydroxyacyl-CoA dehydrogenase/enoyl-CoA hydratase/3-hydroxybutyryl-CoA epimerase
VIEAIFEDLEAKKALFRSIEPKMRPDAILATNTSSIPLEELGQSLIRPGRLVGLHFFNPVSQMELVEVVSSPATEPEMQDRAFAFVQKIKKLPLPVKSSPGFLVNRILMPYLLEAVKLVEEGVAPEAVDRAAVNFGMPMGPILLADTVGLDICLSVAKNLGRHFNTEVPKRLEELVAAGRLGKKSGSGFYTFEKGKPVRSGNVGNISPDVVDRLILRLVNEAAACLGEQVAADKDLIDAGVIYGTGFAPFRGGPLQYAEQEGFTQVTKRLGELEGQYGGRFRPGHGWRAVFTRNQ